MGVARRASAAVAVLALAVVLALVLASSCNGTLPSIPATYGSDIVSGAVLMADGGSPAGVEVSVVGTGMRTVVGEDGRFAFQGVRDAVTLRFERSDGIDRTETTAGGSAITVTIPPASRGERGHEAPSALEGNLAALSGNSLVVTTERGDVATVITESTRIHRQGVSIRSGDLGAGDRVRLRTAVREGAVTVLELSVMGDAGPYVVAARPKRSARSG